MIKLKHILNEAKKFGDSVVYTEKGIPFKDGITPELKKEAEDYIKNELKIRFQNDWKFKKWSTDSPRIVKQGTRDAYLFGFCICEGSSKIMGRKYEIEFDITWKPNQKNPNVTWTYDHFGNQIDEDDIAPKVKKWFMEVDPKEMPKTTKHMLARNVPKSFYYPFENDLALSYYAEDVDETYGMQRILEVFEICFDKYYEEYKKQHPTFFQKVVGKVKKMFEDEESSKLKDIMNEKFPDYRELSFFNKEDKLGFTPQDMKNIASFNSAFGKKFKQLIVKKQLVKALPSIYFIDAVRSNEHDIRTTAEKLMSDKVIDLIKNGNLG